MNKKIMVFIINLLVMCLFVSCGEKPYKPVVSQTQFDAANQPISPIPAFSEEESGIVTGTTTEKPVISTRLPEVTTKVEPSDEARISVLAVGDNIPHDSVIQTAKDDASGNAKYDFSKIYAGIANEIKTADIAFINQESPVGGADLGISGYPNFNAPKEMIEELINVGFDVFNIANNHMLDKKEIGYKNTVEYFNSLPITMIGGYTKSDYDNIRIVEKQGIKVAFLSYTDIINEGHKNDISGSSEYIIPYAKDADIKRQIALANERADVVIVSMHWGAEGNFGVTNRQKLLAKLCADEGADVVLGHHPHVVGDVEWINGASGNKTLVAYSLGNFCSSQLYAKNMVGEMLTFDIVKGNDGTSSVENVIVSPVVCHYKTDRSKKDNQNLHVRYEVRMYMMSEYTEDLANSHGAQNWGAFTFATLKRYITGDDSYASVGKEFLPNYMH